MTTMYERCAGLDVHKATVVATVRVPSLEGGRHSETTTFATTTAGLLALRDWLQAFGVTQVALESTGVYWKPIYYLLEDGFGLVLVNMQHLSHVPGRKSDVNDSQWLAQLLESGLLRASLVLPQPFRDLRDLTRYRTKQLADRSAEVNRLHRVLDDAGIKLATVATDVMGVSGRRMMDALLQGTTDPAVLADLACGRLRKKLPALRAALAGHFRPHHAFLLGQILGKLDFLDEAIGLLTTELDRLLAPFEPVLANLDTIPGVDRRTATTLLVETGGDMTKFPTVSHCCSWAGVVPGQHESAGKRRSSRCRKGNTFLRRDLNQSALAATRANRTALQARYARVKRHRGHKKAIGAVAHQILEIAYHIMRDGVTYHELGAHYFERRHRERTVRRHLHQLEALGYRVTLEVAA